jgi:predicted DNA-binding WGR domain protein
VSDWDVDLAYTDAKSNKFWRAKVEGSTLTINFGRIGTNGQTQLKELGSPEAAEKERDKVANSKRKKGYEDQAPVAEKEPEAPAMQVVAAVDGPQVLDLVLSADGRKVDVRLALDGDKLRTVVVESYDGDQTAQAAFLRVKQAMLKDGYETTKRESL